MREIYIEDRGGSADFVAKPLENQLLGLKRAGFSVSQIEARSQEEGGRVVVFESRDSKLAKTVENAARTAQTLVNLKLTQNVSQSFGVPVMIRVGRESVPMEKITFEEIDESVNNLISERFREKLGKNQKIASILSRVRAWMG